MLGPVGGSSPSPHRPALYHDIRVPILGMGGVMKPRAGFSFRAVRRRNRRRVLSRFLSSVRTALRSFDLPAIRRPRHCLAESLICRIGELGPVHGGHSGGLSWVPIRSARSRDSPSAGPVLPSPDRPCVTAAFRFQNPHFQNGALQEIRLRQGQLTLRAVKPQFGGRCNSSLAELAHDQASPNPGSRRVSLIVDKLPDHDIGVSILGMGREVASSRRIRILVIATTYLHDLERTALLAPVLKHVNCVGKSGDG
jgi:hypothetical protein